MYSVNNQNKIKFNDVIKANIKSIGIQKPAY